MTCRRAALVAAVLLLTGCGGGTSDEGRSAAIAAAKDAYAKAKAQGVDFDRGPCLGLVKPGWVADVAHDPRRDVDDRPENQCAAYRSGEADHFVELDPEGRLIRTG
jgi:hypothetical protein